MFNPGDTIRLIKSGRTVIATVKTAINHGSVAEPDWFIEGNRTDTGAPIYVKQLYDGVTIEKAKAGRKLLGYQFARDGVNIAGDDDDPTANPSYAIIPPEYAEDWRLVSEAQGLDLELQPIYEGDIEEPVFGGSPRDAGL
jgi:hypothetical protein